MPTQQIHPWKLHYRGFDAQQEGLREALCTLGNGYLAMRGAAVEAQTDGIHYPATYLAGGYNRLWSQVGEQTVSNEDLVRFPNGLALSFRIEQGAWFVPGKAQLLDYEQILNMQSGFLQRKLRFADDQGRETTVQCQWLVHAAHPHLAALKYIIIPENWSGQLTIQSMLDGAVKNWGVARYRQLSHEHLKVIDLGSINENGFYLNVETNHSHLQVSLCSGIKIESNHQQPVIKKTSTKVCQQFTLFACQHHPIKIEKTVALYTNKDPGISEFDTAARQAIESAGGFQTLLTSHQQRWQHLWRRCDIAVESSPEEQQLIHLHTFHLLQSASWHSSAKDVGIGARGLHGEAYRGHVFWDEIYILPFYTYWLPEISRALLLYRYHRLPMARKLAQQAGYRGAMFPWQSAGSGDEETPTVHLNPQSQTWGPDYSHYQRHINIAIVYNIWHYYLVTGDNVFLHHYGAEMMLNIACFWSSLATYNTKTKRYEILGVMGPDEYHEKYPGTTSPGLNNNAYTNVMVVWVLKVALQVLRLLPKLRRQELMEQSQINWQELLRWRRIQRKMTVPFHDEGIISQFTGYDQLKELDWKSYQARYGNIQRMDRILKAEGGSPDHYKVVKQADVVMLFYLLPRQEINHLFQQMDYPAPDMERITQYYYRRTSHGSTLSRVVFAAVLHAFDRNKARNEYWQALQSDKHDIQGGTTAEGIHLGVMAGTLNIVLYQYAGLHPLAEQLSFSPCLPEDIRKLRFRLQYQSRWYSIEVTQGQFSILLEKDNGPSTVIQVFDQSITLFPGQNRLVLL